MTKKIISLILAAMLVTVSGCSNGTNEQMTTENTVPVSDVMDYEMYIEDLDYYMNQYVQSYESAAEAYRTQDSSSAKNYLGNALDALNSLRNIIYPPNLEDIHSELLSSAELQKKVIECDIELTSFGASDELSDEERNSLNALNAKAAEILAEIEEKGRVSDAWHNAKNAAFSYIPNGEYRAYASTLEALFNDYITEVNKLYGIIFDGTGGNALLICENLTETFSEIENMEVPEQLKTYHDEIIEAISIERECCSTVESFVALGSGYQGVAFEDLPADVQAQMGECMEKIDSFFDEENEDFAALYNAVVSALEFAESKAGI